MDEANQQGEGLQLDAPLTALGERLNNLNAIFKRERGSDLTPELAGQDDRRDRALAGISLFLKAYTNHYDEALQEAASRLIDHFGSYGSVIYKMSYQEETAVVSDLLQEWQNNTSRAEDVAALGLADWLAELTAANNEFDTLYKARASEAPQAPEMSMEDARIDATADYRTLASHIEAYAVINPTNPTGN
ncbi:MAG: DUF6261 family protein [Bacteroidales bacterium]|nr:DUF6261 family protein [Bacteroidales bacterium]